MPKLATKTTKLTLIRHSKVLDPTICYGQMDVPLNEADFERSVAHLKAQFGELRTLYSSPSMRCLKLANALSNHVIIVDDLLEMNFGAWQNQAWSDIPRDEIDAWANDVRHYTIPNGESCDAFFLRAKRGLERLPDHAIVITHAGIIRASLFWFESKNFEQASQFTVEYAKSYTVNSNNVI